MTRDQAAKLINDELADQHLANNIAAALDALGLLNLGKLAYHPDFKPPGQEPEDIGKADPQPAYAGAQRVGSLSPPPDEPVMGQGNLTSHPDFADAQSWASRRERT